MKIFNTLALATIAVGMLAASAHAADLPFRLSPIPAAVISGYSWTGAYVGADVGKAINGKANYEHQNVNNFGGPGGTYDMALDGYVGGVHAGALYDFKPIVVGAEVGYDWSGITGDHNFTQYNNDTTTSVGNIITAKAIAGVGFDRALIFAEGGYAGGNVTAGQTYSPQNLSWSNTQFHNGYVVGAGVKYAVTDNVIIGVKYDHFNFGDSEFAGNDSSGKYTNIKGNSAFDVVSASIDFKF
jgi:outer membrane immunogenic protein